MTAALANIQYAIQPALSDAALQALFAAAWPAQAPRAFQPILQRSLSYLGALADGQLIGFINLAWDGGVHAFLLDPTVHPAWRRRGIGSHLVHVAIDIARQRGIHWLHVDYEPHLDGFYRRCGFQPTLAGVLLLQPAEPLR